MADFDVADVARLARLQLTPEETALFQGQLARVLRYADELAGIDVTGVEAAAHSIPMFDVTRADEARPGFSAEEALANAPRQANHLFLVTKVVE